MNSMDSPHRQRPLAGVDQALGEGRARQPTELLDQLRERLARLDSNHPSASRRSADHPDGGDSDIGVEPEVTVSGENDRAQADAVREIGEQESGAGTPDRPRESPDGQDADHRGRPDAERGSDLAGDGDPGGGPGDATDADPAPAESGEPARSWSDGAATSGDGTGQGPYDAGSGWPRRPGSGEAYRPWFAGDESVTPWFAE